MISEYQKNVRIIAGETTGSTPGIGQIMQQRAVSNQAVGKTSPTNILVNCNQK